MVFGKRYPKDKPGSNFPEWVEIQLTEEEEREIEEKARQENIRLMKQCLDDATSLLKDKGFRDYDNNRIEIAKTLFDKLASHSVYWKEAECKDRFDKS